MNIDLSTLSVGVGFPTGPMVPWQTTMSLVSTARACERAKIPFGVHLIAGNSVVTAARDLVLTAFLKGDKSRLFWIDSDIVWTPADFTRILQLTTVHSIVGATYPVKTGLRAGTYVINAHDGDLEADEYGCLKVKSFGLGFCCMTREVVEKIVATKNKVVGGVGATEMYSVFRCDTLPNGSARGEDVAFFDDARELGFDVWLDPTIKLGHVGTHVFTGDPVKFLGLESVYKQD